MSEAERDAALSRFHYCPECKQALRRIEGKMGPFWGCSAFPKCRYSLNDVDGKPSTEIDEDFRCPICTRRLVRAEKDKGDYWFCSGYAKGCKTTLKDDHGRPQLTFRCPACGDLLVKREGKKGEFWGCNRYPECKTSFSDNNNEPDFDLFTPQRS